MNRDKVNIITKICFGLFGFLLAVSAVIVTYNNPESWRNNVLVVILAALMIQGKQY